MQRVFKLVQLLPDGIVQRLTAGYFRFKHWRSVSGYLHSQAQALNMGSMTVELLPALQDNYMYLLIDNDTKKAAIVDPVDPPSVLAAVARHGCTLTSILTTHHHWDHAGGNEKLVASFAAANDGRKLTVYGADDRIGGLTDRVEHDQVLEVGALRVRCLFTPCHTTGHMCYYVEAIDEKRVVFTGDTLFLGGCGRFFEGTAEQMYAALIEKLSALPDDTLVYCGHEYALQNLAYARHVEPLNGDVSAKLRWAEKRRADGLPTVPSTLAEEKLYNPFMRVQNAEVHKFSGCQDEIKTMRVLRAEKDTFVGPK